MATDPALELRRRKKKTTSATTATNRSDPTTAPAISGVLSVEVGSVARADNAVVVAVVVKGFLAGVVVGVGGDVAPVVSGVVGDGVCGGVAGDVVVVHDVVVGVGSGVGLGVGSGVGLGVGAGVTGQSTRGAVQLQKVLRGVALHDTQFSSMRHAVSEDSDAKNEKSVIVLDCAANVARPVSRLSSDGKRDKLVFPRLRALNAVH